MKVMLIVTLIFMLIRMSIDKVVAAIVTWMRIYEMCGRKLHSWDKISCARVRRLRQHGNAQAAFVIRALCAWNHLHLRE